MITEGKKFLEEFPPYEPRQPDFWDPMGAPPINWYGDDDKQITAIVHIGHEIPKAFKKAGWREVSAMHLGHGCWMFRLEKRKEPNAT